MGDVEPTELAPTETATESVRAWGLADYDEEMPTTRLTSGWITGGAVAGSLVVIVVASVVGWQHLHRRAVEPAPSMVPAAAPTTTEAPQPKFDGTFSVFHDWIHTTYRNNKTDTGGTVHWNADGEPSYVTWVFSSTCTNADCIATGHMLNEQGVTTGNPRVFQFVNGAWEDLSPTRWQSKCTYLSDGALAGRSWWSQTLRFTPRPDGTLEGTMTTAVETNECGDMGDTAVTPLVATLVP